MHLTSRRSARSSTRSTTDWWSCWAERGALIEEVVRYKRANAMPVVDRAREDRMLARLASRADARGLDPRVVTTVVRAVIDAFTLVEVEELGEVGSSGTAPS